MKYKTNKNTKKLESVTFGSVFKGEGTAGGTCLDGRQFLLTQRYGKEPHTLLCVDLKDGSCYDFPFQLEVEVIEEENRI